MMKLLPPERAGQAAIGLCATRGLIGAACLVAPRLARAWVGPTASSGGGRMLVRSVGGRDLALGIGAVFAARHGSALRGWMEAGALADASDLLGALLALGELPSPSRWALVGVTAASTLSGGALARAVTPSS